MRKIEIYGGGCAKCKATEENARKAVKELAAQAEVVPIFDKAAAIRKGITDTPALLLDGQLKVSGRIAEVEEIKRFLSVQ